MIAIEEAIPAIERFNASAGNLACDSLTAMSFSRMTKNADRAIVASCVVLIDGLWGTQLFRQPGMRDQVIERICECWSGVHHLFSQLRPDDLIERPSHIRGIAGQVLSFVCEGGPRQNYVFCTKFIHWCTRRHFPIVDSNARAELYHRQGTADVGWSERVGRSGPDKRKCLEDYGKWIHLVRRILLGWSDADLHRLQEVDKQACSRDTEFNSGLRIVDKVLYQLGKERRQRG